MSCKRVTHGRLCPCNPMSKLEALACLWSHKSHSATFKKGIKGLVNCVYKPCPSGMPLARWDSNNAHLKHLFQSQKNCQCVSCSKVLQCDWTTLCSAAWSNHIAAPCDTFSIDNSPDAYFYAEVLLACKSKLWKPQHLQCSIKRSCLVVGTRLWQVPPHETTFCLPDVTWHHYTWQHLPCFLSLLCKQKGIKY